MRLPSPFRVAALAMLLVPVASGLSAQETDGGAVPRTITVLGQGTVEAVPDVADILTGVVTRADSARAAIDRNGEAMTELLAALRDMGVAEKDIRTSGFRLSPQYSRAQRDQPREITGYQVSNQVTVTVRDLKRIGALIDKAITAGSNSVNGVRFGIADPDRLMDEARRKAMAEAKRRAELLAAEAGVTVGRVLRIQEGGSRMPAPRMTLEARSVPIAPGTEEVVANVSVQYELR